MEFALDPVLFASLLGFVLIASITPGPNNAMVMISGAAFGWRRTVPHIAGITVGMAVFLAAAVFGLGALIERAGMLLPVVKTLGAAWLAWLAWRFLRAAVVGSGSGPGSRGQAAGRPLRFHEAALFQWVNPKAIVFAVSVASAYIELAPSPLARAALIVGAFLLVGPASVLAWVFAGAGLSRLLAGPRTGPWLNAAMGVVILLTAVLILLS